MNKSLLKSGVLLFVSAILYSCASAPQNSSSKGKEQKKPSEAEIAQIIKEYYSAEPAFHDKPEDVQIVWQDVDAFWAAVDAAKQPDGSFDEGIFNTTYRENKTGQFDRHSKFFFGSEDKLYQTHPFIEFYSSFRDALTDKTILPRETYISYLKKLQKYYPQAKFPNVYFAISRMNQGGTATPVGIMLFPAMFQKNTSADITKIGTLKPKVFLEGVAKQDSKDMALVAIHELMHFQQMLAGVKLFYRQLLNVALIEGSAEFLASVITGESFLDKDNIAYGEANETMLWQKFKEDIKTNKSDHWLYNGAKNKEERGGLPVDMGYWVGFRIAKSYWDNMADKQQAFRDILLWKDANEFLQKSGYDALHSKNK